jgi:hypothetical protein
MIPKSCMTFLDHASLHAVDPRIKSADAAAMQEETRSSGAFFTISACYRVDTRNKRAHDGGESEARGASRICDRPRLEVGKD